MVIPRLSYSRPEVWGEDSIPQLGGCKDMTHKVFTCVIAYSKKKKKNKLPNNKKYPDN